MRYRAENQLELFEFHDADLSFLGVDGDDLIVSAKHVNIHKNTAQNPSDYDMEIDCARLTFRGFRPLSYEPGRPWEIDQEGELHPIGPQIVFSGQDAGVKFTEALHKRIWVYYFGAKDGGGYVMEGNAVDPYFTMEFDFDSLVVEWDGYRKKAWYELHRQYGYDLTLETAQGEEQVEVHVICHDEDTYYKGKLESAPTVTVGLTYGGKEFWGRGKEYLWVDAFADLQRQLPDGVRLKCCLSCRHGNMCPGGNVPNALFCTKDVVIEKKSDLRFYTEDHAERVKRARTYCDLCADFRPRSDEYYTCNDDPCR